VADTAHHTGPLTIGPLPVGQLHIGIDGRELVGRPTGVGRYLSQIIRTWIARGLRHRITIFVPADPPAALAAAAGDAIRWSVLPASTAGTMWEQTRLPAALRRTGVDVLLAPAYTAPLSRPCPVVLAIHDLSYFAHPEWFGWREGLRRRWVTRAAARRASAIITLSAFSAAEIVRYLGVSPDCVRLAPPGAPPLAPEVKPQVNPGLTQGGPPGMAPERAATAGVGRRPVVLYVGSLFNRRHLPEMLTGFARIAGRVPGAQFVLVGDNRTSPRIEPAALADALGIGARVSWRQYVTDDELETLYGQARAFLFLSEYEGFAMTPLEALAHGVPVVLLDTPIAREVYGTAAALVSLDPEVIASTLEPLLTDDAAHRTAVSRGLDQLAAYDWTRSAAVVLDALERAAIPADAR
jgi:glycosyltransferase involved in cell wall biosynthesis